MIPVLITAYRRLDTLKRTIESLKRCDGECLIYAYLDGGYSAEVEDYLKGECKVITSNEHRGIKGHTLLSIDEMKSNFDKFIFIQDDMEFSKDFLLFMEWALREFKDNNLIMCVSAYTKINHPYCYTSYIPSEALGIWSKKWNLERLDISDKEFMKRWERETIFIPDMAVQSVRGKNDSFSVVLAYTLFKQKKFCLHPDRNKLRHLVTDSVNCKASDVKHLNQELYEGWNRTVDMFLGRDKLKEAHKRKWYKKMTRKFRNKLEDYCDPIIERVKK